MVDAGRPYPLGATPATEGTNVAIASAEADSVEICLFDADGVETKVESPERTADVFHGLRCNADKLLIDPHATAVTGQIEWGEAVFAHLFDDADAYDDADSAAAMPKCVVTDRGFGGGDDAAPRTPLAETVVYERTSRASPNATPTCRRTSPAPTPGWPTRDHRAPDRSGRHGGGAAAGAPIRAGLPSARPGPAQLLGVHSIGFLAPHGEYSSVGDDGGQVAEFTAMVKALHGAGLEVILDVDYNHTAEGDDQGPCLSLKGIDNPAYYRLVEDDRAHYFDTTGTGNSLNVGYPTALRLIMDSLRYWVSEMHVNGFRFDLATTLTRQSGEQDIHSAFLDLIYQDPVLAPVTMIAEPWDTAGYPGRRVPGTLVGVERQVSR